MTRRTFYVYKAFDRDNAVAIIASNVGQERMVSEVKRLHALHGHITIRNALGGLVSEVRHGKINSFCQ